MNKHFDVVGWLGVAALFLSYGLYTFSVFSAQSFQFNVLNLLGAGALTFFAFGKKVWPLGVFMLAWTLLSAYSLYVYL